MPGSHVSFASAVPTSRAGHGQIAIPEQLGSLLLGQTQTWKHHRQEQNMVIPVAFSEQVMPAGGVEHFIPVDSYLLASAIAYLVHHHFTASATANMEHVWNRVQAYYQAILFH